MLAAVFLVFVGLGAAFGALVFAVGGLPSLVGGTFLVSVVLTLGIATRLRSAT